MNKFFKIDENLKQLANKSELESQEQFEKIEKIELQENGCAPDDLYINTGNPAEGRNF